MLEASTYQLSYTLLKMCIRFCEEVGEQVVRWRRERIWTYKRERERERERGWFKKRNGGMN